MSKLPQATHGSLNNPLKIGDISLPCVVLDDGRRVITRSGILSALGLVRGGGVLAKFVAQNRLSPFVSNDLTVGVSAPIKFTPKGGGKAAYGYEARLLMEICDAVVQARNAGVLAKNQQHIAARCDAIVHASWRTGLLSDIDEWTGYQYLREPDALQKIANAYLSNKLEEWQRTFSRTYYAEIYRLKGWDLPPPGQNYRWDLGKITNEIIYRRLAPGVLAELEKRNPVRDSGHRGNCHHQHLRRDVGHPELRRHLAGVVALLKTARSWPQFLVALDVAYPVEVDAPLFAREMVPVG